MAGKRPDNDLSEIQAIMGSKFADAVTPGSEFTPPRQNLPQRPQRPMPKHLEGVTLQKAPFPIVPEADVHKYPTDDRAPSEVMAFGKTGYADAELNEMALRKVAEARGMTVAELLQQKPDTKLENKVRMVTSEAEARTLEDSEQMANAEVEKSPEELELELQEIEARKKLASARAAREREARRQEEAAKAERAQAVPVDRKRPAAQHPLLKSLREKFSLDTIQPVSVMIEGNSFMLHPAPQGLQHWVLEKIQTAQISGSEQALVTTIRAAAVAQGLIAIDGISIARLFGLTSQEIEDPSRVSIEMRTLMAQTVWEMIVGMPSIEDLFTFHPDMVLKLYEAYDKGFKDKIFQSSLDGAMRRYTCPYEDCTETLDRHNETGSPIFCPVHGVPMDDHGELKDLRSVPLL